MSSSSDIDETKGEDASVGSGEQISVSSPSLAAGLGSPVSEDSEGLPPPMEKVEDDSSECKKETGFEGPEKALEIDFLPRDDIEDDPGMRDVTREEWDAILLEARCTILCTRSNDRFDSYVLSESSLFVYPYKVVMKTCGTTTLLRAIGPLKAAAKRLGLVVEWVCYSRKDYSFPEEQDFPHTNFRHEVTALKKHFPEGNAYVLGPVTDDHWFIFVADYCEREPSTALDRTLEIKMYDLHPTFAGKFFKGEDFTTARDVTIKSGIRDLLPHADIQEFQFEPCGYSMNGLLFDAYYTIHITPESHCSYGSFETNVRQPSYNALVRNVLSVFRPERFTLTLFADRAGVRELTSNPVTVKEMKSRLYSYVQTTESSTRFEGDYCCFMANYKIVKGRDTSPMRTRTTSVDAYV